MALFVRKIEKSKWMQTRVFDGEQPSADAITGSLRTRANTLSVWRIESLSELDEAVLAFVCQGEHLDTIDVVMFDERALVPHGLPTRQSQADTPYISFTQKHHDVHSLDYGSLGSMAAIVIDSLRNDLSQRYTRGQLKKLVQQAIDRGGVDIGQLNPKIAEAVDPA